MAPPERARLFARLWRAHDRRELARLRETIPDAAAGAVYNRAARILRQLHGSMPPTLLAIRNGIERDTWLLFHLYDLEADGRRVRAALHRLWGVVGYPVTEGERQALVAIERVEPERLDDYAERLAEFEGREDGLRPEVAALLSDLPPDLRLERRGFRDWREPEQRPSETELEEEERRRRAIAACVRVVLGEAVERGELPMPVDAGDGAALPWGVLHDWGEGTTAETFESFGPGYHVPALSLLGGDFAGWDVRPDGEVGAVRERRAALLQALAPLADHLGTIDADALERLGLEPPSSAEERERAHAGVRGLWPPDPDVRGNLRRLTVEHAERRAHLGAYEAAVERVRREEFGGEDPLAPMLRGLLDLTAATERRYEELWAAVVAALRPVLGEGDWPPPLEDAAVAEELRAEVEEHLHGDWDA